MSANAEPTPPADGAASDASDGSAKRRQREENDRPELFSLAKDKLSRVEKLNVWWSRLTFASKFLNALCAWGERVPGAAWIDRFTINIREAHGLDRIPPFDSLGNFILVSNHRSYFDMYVISMILFRHGLRRRILFPVRSGFFYDSILGFFVNGLMSFWSMYPPIFRDRKRAVLNHTALSEVIWALKNSRIGVGIHPEGTRNKGDDPYTLLPVQSGVGRVIHESRAPVIPVFINGLGNRLDKQVKGNFNGKGNKIIVVFGAPIDFASDLEAPANARTFKTIAERTREEITKLGYEEKAIRVLSGMGTPQS